MNTVDNIRRSPDDIRELAAVWPLCFLFKLPPGASVLVAGAYKGKVMQLLADMYPYYGWIYGLEPQPWAYDQAQMRLAGYANMTIFPYGIGAKEGTFPMGEWETDACSFVNTGESARQHGQGKLKLAENIFDELGFLNKNLALAVFNMEGYEFELLPYLIDKGLMPYIDRLAVQFHHNLGNDENWAETMILLDDTHQLVVNQHPQWMYFERTNLHAIWT